MYTRSWIERCLQLLGLSTILTEFRLLPSNPPGNMDFEVTTNYSNFIYAARHHIRLDCFRSFHTYWKTLFHYLFLSCNRERINYSYNFKNYSVYDNSVGAKCVTRTWNWLNLTTEAVGSTWVVESVFVVKGQHEDCHIMRNGTYFSILVNWSSWPTLRFRNCLWRTLWQKCRLHTQPVIGTTFVARSHNFWVPPHKHCKFASFSHIILTFHLEI
jgi:hypothetical protein